MAKVKDCPGFETFGADVKEARKAKNLARKDLAEKVNIDTRYLANIENEGTIPQPAGHHTACKKSAACRWRDISIQRSCERKASCASGSDRS